MDYYGPMVLFQSFRTAALTTVIAVAAHTAWAQQTDGDSSPASSDPAVASNPALDAELFYEIFLGEISARTGDPGAGYAFMLEAARRSADGQLYQRAADIALQSRSGEYALAAAQAWKEALLAKRPICCAMSWPSRRREPRLPCWPHCPRCTAGRATRHWPPRW
jgi:hypothetical protein